MFACWKYKGKKAYENKEKYLDIIRINTLSREEHYILGLAYTVNGQDRLAQKHFNKAKEFGYKNGGLNGRH